jgi:predicted ABC-type ATPase
MELYIIAGPNGAGKTTFAREFLPNHANCTNFVNADLIAQGMAPFSPETAAIRAGRTMLQEIHSLAERRVSFAFETTLSGRSYLGLLRKLKSKGSDFHVFFLWLKTLDSPVPSRLPISGAIFFRKARIRIADANRETPANTKPPRKLPVRWLIAPIA